MARKYAYTREAFYRDRHVAFREAKRLRKTGRYNAKVLKTDIPNKLPWTLWTQLRSARP